MFQAETASAKSDCSKSLRRSYNFRFLRITNPLEFRQNAMEMIDASET